MSVLHDMCACYLYVQKYHWCGGQYALRITQDIFTVGAPTVSALKDERKGGELSIGLAYALPL